MSYAQAIKWSRKHPRGGKIQPVLMHTDSGFWPSGSFVAHYQEYVDRCNVSGVKPVTCKELYDSELSH